MSDNMRIYNMGRTVPDEAKREITGGKLKGKTDINPMWRIEKLTEIFGPCGVGWKMVNVNFWSEQGANGELIAFCSGGLTYRDNEQWSDPVYGIGGSTLIEKNKNGLQSSDECYKMAYTDMISVCCKMLGIGASVYWEAGESKYLKAQNEKDDKNSPLCADCGREITGYRWPNGAATNAGKVARQTKERFGVSLCGDCYTKRMKLNGGQEESA